MTIEELEALIDNWVQQRWLRPLDQAFMQFLRELDQATDPLCFLAATLASHQLGRGHICLDLDATLKAPDDALSLPPEGQEGERFADLPSQILANLTLADWQNALASSPLVAPAAGNTPLVLADNRLYLRRYWQYEQQVAAAIKARVKHPVEMPTGMKDRLDKLFSSEASKEPDWQKIACALAARNAFTIITGGPGTGKTTTVANLLVLLQGAALQQPPGTKLRIRLAAPTGKAAARLTESIGFAITQLKHLDESLRTAIPTKATTLHRLLGSLPETRHMRHCADNPLHADLVVVDEASMIDLEMMANLLDALRPDTRLVLLGDKDQLASVEAGSVLGELCKDVASSQFSLDTASWLTEVTGTDIHGFTGESGPLGEQIAMLHVSHRFTGDSGIGALSKAVNSGDAEAVKAVWTRCPCYSDIAEMILQDQKDSTFDRFIKSGDSGRTSKAADDSAVSTKNGYRHYLEVISQQRPTDDHHYEKWCEDVLTAFDQFQLLCALRRGPWGVEQLNQRIADVLCKAGLIEKTSGWYEGRPVLVTRNDYSLGLMNGDIGIALKLPSESRQSTPEESTSIRVVFRMPDGGIKRVLPSRLTDIETVYAMTVHKSQGSEFSHIGLLLPDKINPILTRELIYTGITRAKNWFTLLTPQPDIVEQAVVNRVRRTGGLSQLLKA